MNRLGCRLAFGSMPQLTAQMVRDHLGLVPIADHVAVHVVHTERAHGYRRVRLDVACPDGDVMPAFLLVPDDARGAPGVLVFHQHGGVWHLGKSEVCGLAGETTNAFGPALARAGLVVLAPDAVGFEDRRRTTSGTDPHPDDAAQHEREASYRLLQGRTLAQKVVNDAQTALSALATRPEVDAGRVGVLGHSFGGNTVIFHAATDPRIAFAATSGAAATYRARMAHEVGIERASVVPGAIALFDIDDLTRLIAPRPLGIFAGDDDRYALDAADIGESARVVYRRLGAADRLHVSITPGPHSLTEARFAAIVNWVIEVATHG